MKPKRYIASVAALGMLSCTTMAGGIGSVASTVLGGLASGAAEGLINAAGNAGVKNGHNVLGQVEIEKEVRIKNLSNTAGLQRIADNALHKVKAKNVKMQTKVVVDQVSNTAGSQRIANTVLDNVHADGDINIETTVTAKSISNTAGVQEIANTVVTDTRLESLSVKKVLAFDTVSNIGGFQSIGNDYL